MPDPDDDLIERIRKLRGQGPGVGTAAPSEAVAPIVEGQDLEERIRELRSERSTAPPLPTPGGFIEEEQRKDAAKLPVPGDREERRGSIVRGLSKFGRFLGSGAELAAFGRGGKEPFLESVDWVQRNVSDPVSATATSFDPPLGPLDYELPGPSFANRRQGLNPAQLPWKPGWREAYRENVPPAARISSDIVTDPLNIVPGVGFTKLSQFRRLAQLAKQLPPAERAVLETEIARRVARETGIPSVRAREAPTPYGDLSDEEFTAYAEQMASGEEFGQVGVAGWEPLTGRPVPGPTGRQWPKLQPTPGAPPEQLDYEAAFARLSPEKQAAVQVEEARVLAETMTQVVRESPLKRLILALGPGRTQFAETLTPKQALLIYSKGVPFGGTNAEALAEIRRIYPRAITPGGRVRPQYALDDVMYQYGKRYTEGDGVELLLRDIETAKVLQGKAITKRLEALRLAEELTPEMIRANRLRAEKGLKPVNRTEYEMATERAARPLLQTGAIQTGMGIGETPPQGVLSLGGQEGISRPLIDAGQVAERQRLVAEQAAGQAALPAPGQAPVAPTVAAAAPPPLPVTPRQAATAASQPSVAAAGIAPQEPPAGGAAATLSQPPAQPPPPRRPSTAPGNEESNIQWFSEFLKDPRRIEDWDLTQAERTAVRGERAESFKSLLDRLVEEGYTSEEAMKRATKAFSGGLPTAVTGIQDIVTPAIREALFDRIKLVLADEPYEMAATQTALGNALSGRAIPRTPGAAGGSAYSRLVRVFGDEIAEAITKRQTLDEVISLRSGKRGLQTTMGPGRVRGPGEIGTPGPFINYPSAQTFGTARISERNEQIFNLQPAERLTARELLAEPQIPLISEKPPGPFQGTPEGRRLEKIRKEWIALKERLKTVPPSREPLKRLRDLEQRLLAAERENAVAIAAARETRTPFQQNLDRERIQDLMASHFPPKEFRAKGPYTAPPNKQLERAQRLGLPEPTLGENEAIKQLSTIPETTREQMVRWAKTAGLTAIDFGNLLRGSMAGPDLSYIRTQAFLIPGYPIDFIRSFKPALRAAWSKEYAEQMDQVVKTRLSKYITHIPRWYRSLDGKIAKAWEREENYLILGGDRPLQKLAAKIPWIHIGNRAYITGLNKMNADIFINHAEMLLRINGEIASRRITLKPGQVFNLKGSMDSFEKMLADMSGRGPLGPLRELSEPLNAGFFSVRLNIGRLLSPRHLFSGDPFTRRAAWKNFLTAIGTYSGLIFAGQQMGLWDLETDQRSSDFMKIRLGNLRVDIWGGYQQYAVLYGRLLPVVGGIKSTKTGGISDWDPVEGASRFARTKASPLISQVLMAWTAEDFKGSAIDRRDWQRWLKDNAPFAVQDVIEAFQNEGLVGLFAGLPAGVVGAGLYGQPPSLNDVAQELYGISYSDIPTTDSGADARERIRGELVKRLSERETKLAEKEEEATKKRRKQREAERQKKWDQQPRFESVPVPSTSPSGPAQDDEDLIERIRKLRERQLAPVGQ